MTQSNVSETDFPWTDERTVNVYSRNIRHTYKPAHLQAHGSSLWNHFLPWMCLIEHLSITFLCLEHLRLRVMLEILSKVEINMYGITLDNLNQMLTTFRILTNIQGEMFAVIYVIYYWGLPILPDLYLNHFLRKSHKPSCLTSWPAKYAYPAN